MNEETAVTPTGEMQLTSGTDIQLTATQTGEIATAQLALIEWVVRKISELQAEHKELTDAHDNAVQNNWSHDGLKRLAAKTLKRIDFYEKMRSALEHGYVIIPNFPVTVFAIRTSKDKPLKLAGTSWRDTHEQKAETLPEGVGDYKNPFPLVLQREYPDPTKENPDRVTAHYWAEDWKELDFPIQMAKLKIMEATNRAMALRCFDDFGIMPERKKEDPIIVARLLDPRSTQYNRRFVTFMVAWHLNTRDL